MQFASSNSSTRKLFSENNILIETNNTSLAQVIEQIKTQWGI